jgi:RHS repeat-associated protein
MKLRFFCLLLFGVTTTAFGQSTPVKVNRTVPNVSPPKTTLEFPANPTTQEISRARVFEVSLVPVGGEPSVEENAALAGALLGYAKRTGPDDFSSLTEFLDTHPNSTWRAALLTGLGFEYYNTAHYSLALEAWREALQHTGDAKDTAGRLVLARAGEELASMYGRLGRMPELEALLKATGNDVAPGAPQKVIRAREALSLMRNQPEVSFRCGSLALQSIKQSIDPQTALSEEIRNAASTTNGFSLAEVAELSKKVGLNYQMAFRSSRRESALSASPKGVSGLTSAATSTDFIVPSVVHWKVGHYAAMVRQVGDRYLLQDPTFGNSVWATRQVLEAETSGYFLIPSRDLPPGWRAVEVQEGASIWGKGQTGANDDDVYGPNDLQTGGTCPANGMPVSSVHLMTVNLNIGDTPLAYTPPVGPAVRFTFRYNSRDIYATEQIFGGYYWNGVANAGPTPPVNYVSSYTGMTHDWNSYLIDSPQSPLADVKWVEGGGGARTFTGFNSNSQTFAFQIFDQTQLKRTGTNSYEMLWPDGSKMIFSQPNGSVGSSRRIYLTQIADAAGNALTFTYDQDLRLVAVTDAIGQVTTLSYGDGANLPSTMITRVTDPFGRFATFEYEKREAVILTFFVEPGHVPQFYHHQYYVMTNMTDTLGLSSQLNVSSLGIVTSMTTPYGVTSFTTGGGGTNGNTRFAETVYPDGSRDRVEYNQSVSNAIPHSVPRTTLPAGMDNIYNEYMFARNTFYWDRNACATAYGDYTKAKNYHWVHKDLNTTAGILAAIKEPLENRVWYTYDGGNFGVGSSSRPNQIGRVLDDGSTQLYEQAYNGFGRLTNSIDPIGRTFSFLYATNGIDLLEIRQTRAANNELLFRATYNAQHRLLSTVDAAGQTNTFTCNARGQVLSTSNAKGETTTYNYDTDGYLTAADGPLPGTNDTVKATYDFFGRVRTMTGVSGYTLTFDYDAMDRVIRITHPDGTFEQFAYDRLDVASVRDRAGRTTVFEYDAMRQLAKRTDPLNRITRFDWCRCGQIKSLTDALGRTTTWRMDVQGRVTAKQYADGSQVQYSYETTTSRLRQVIDEKQQITHFTYSRDNMLKSVAYANSAVPTPGLSFTYDPDYQRVVSMTDGIGTTRYSYNLITGTPTSGAGALASEDGPLPNDTITYGYDELGQAVHRAINGMDSAVAVDAAGRLIGVTNALGAFAYAYDGPSGRLVSKSFPNGQVTERSYGNTVQDLLLQRITHRVGATPISESLYGSDAAGNGINTWSQQTAAQSPDLFTFHYDAVNQLLSATVTNAGSLVNTFAYSYDLAGNRLTEQVGASNYTASYNGLNEIRTTTAPGTTRTNEWDAVNRLVAVNVGNQRTEFTYDGISRMVGIRQLVNGSEVSHRRFVWCGGQICEERDATGGAVIKRFFPQGVKLESGPVTGDFFYTRDHLGSIREVTDGSGNVRARYTYDPYGRRTKLSGDMEADFGFAGMFWSAEANLALTHFRAYDPELGRWLSRDPLPSAEMLEGPNLYAYVHNEPINRIDPLGLCTGSTLCSCVRSPAQARACAEAGIGTAAKVGGPAGTVIEGGRRAAPTIQQWGQARDTIKCGLENTLPAIEAQLPALEAEAPALETALIGIEVSPGTVLRAQQLEQWLIERGQIGRHDYGSKAKEVFRVFGMYEDEFYIFFRNEPFFEKLPVHQRLELAAEYAIERLGINIYDWINAL